MRSPDVQQPPIPFTIQNSVRMLKRSEMWRLSYRVQRYLSFLEDEALYQRLLDVWSNLPNLNADGQIGLQALKGDNPFPWMELWVHVMEEYGLRGLGFPSCVMQEAMIPVPPKSGPAKGARELQELGVNASGHLIKYGNRSWLRETYLTGIWRIAPASYYSSANLCEARRDSELEFSCQIPKFTPHPQATEVLDERFQETLSGVQTLSSKAPGDYYLSCFARTFIYRLFDDFSADCCLIVTDEKIFIDKMLNAFSDFRPRWKGCVRRVDYLDPVIPHSRPDIYFAKHFRYSYQDELRFVWIPTTPISQLAPVFLNLGSLKDCCELLVIDSRRAA